MARSLLLMGPAMRDLLKMVRKQAKESMSQRMELVTKDISGTTSLTETEIFELLMEQFTVASSGMVSTMGEAIFNKYKEEAQFLTTKVILIKESSMEMAD